MSILEDVNSSRYKMPKTRKRPDQENETTNSSSVENNAEPQQRQGKEMKLNRAPHMADKNSNEDVQLDVPSRRKYLIQEIITGILIGAIVILLGVAGWLYFPVFRNFLGAVNAPTQVVSTKTPRPPRTPTITATATTIPTSTPIPLPTSIYQVLDPGMVDPPIPGVAISAIVLNEDKAAQVDPQFNNYQWYSSATIAQQIGKEIPELFYATIGPGSVTWSVDTALEVGIYEIYILDTLYSSAGTLAFTVALGGNPIYPVLGQSTVTYLTTQGKPQQTGDIWRSIGVYVVDHPEKIAVSTKWGQRDMSTIVAIDRVLIARMPISTWALIDQLPKDRLRYVMDDLSAKIETTEKSVEMWLTGTEQQAWGDKFQFLVNPTINYKLIYEWPDPLPTGQWEILAWLPKMNGNGEASYRLLVDGNELQPSNGTSPVLINQGSRQKSEWVSLGVWTVPEVYGQSVMLTLEMAIKGGTPGEMAADAIAFVKSP